MCAGSTNIINNKNYIMYEVVLFLSFNSILRDCQTLHNFNSLLLNISCDGVRRGQFALYAFCSITATDIIMFINS